MPHSKEENDMAKDKEPQVQIDYCCGAYDSETCQYCNEKVESNV